MKSRSNIWLLSFFILYLASQSFNRVISNHSHHKKKNNLRISNKNSDDKNIIQKRFFGIERHLRQIHDHRKIQIDFQPVRNERKRRMRNFSIKNRFSKSNKKHLSKKVKKLEQKSRLLDLAKRIQEQTKKNKVKVKNIRLGKKLKKRMGDSHLERHLKNLISKRNLKKIITKNKRDLRKAIKKMKRKNRNKKRKKKNINKQSQIQSTNNPNPTVSRGLVGGSSMGGGSSSSSGSGGEQDMSKFNFMPGFAGMPFPPFMMNGPHFHPPLNVTVNSLPNQDSRLEMNPYEIEETNLKTQTESMKPLEDQMKEIMNNIRGISGDANVQLNQQYDEIEQLNG